MRKIALLLGLFLFAAILRAEEPGAVTLFDNKYPVDSIIRQDVALTPEADGLVVAAGENEPWPGIHLKGDWNLASHPEVIVTVTNLSDKEIRLFCRFDSKKSKGVEGTFTANALFAPKERKEWRFTLGGFLNLDVRKKLFAMRGKPGGIKTDHFSQDKIDALFDRSCLTDIIVFEDQKKAKNSWKLESIVAPKADVSNDYLLWGPDQFFPMIDRFGQFIHKDWPGKIHSLDELRGNIAKEAADLAAHQPTDRTKFGGWASGPKFEATGKFYPKKINGKWWLIDPEGALFWSHGVDCVGWSNGVTPITDREFYFAALPKEGEPTARFYGKSYHSVNNYYAGRGEFRIFNFTAANAFLKYGDDWQNDYARIAHERLKSWGMNTIANWSTPEIYSMDKTPYTDSFGVGSPRIEASAGYWGKFVDPFHPEFAAAARKSLEGKKKSAVDPFCIGYFVDNEISWGEAGSLTRAALSSKKDQPAKIALVEWLKKKYKNLDAFNQAWGTKFAAWDELLEKPFNAPKEGPAADDCLAFEAQIAEKYFSELAEAIHEAAPGKLYLGCRFAWTNDIAQTAAAKYCDVVSYNFYRHDLSDVKPKGDKPVIVGEFHFGALDRGLFHTGLVPVADQNGRAEAYRGYVTGALKNPYIVGTHWFQYGDQATSGRFDGENYQIGLVDLCDTPYQETIEAVREVGREMYKIRSEK